MVRLLTLVLCALLLHADSPSQFWGAARIQLLHQLSNGSNPAGAPVDTTVESIDLTHQRPVMLNRWALRFPYTSLASWKQWAWVTGMCDGEGNVWVLISGWGLVKLIPYNQQVWSAMHQVLAFETRWQLVTVSQHEVLIEEPLEVK